ncbi:MAG: hypothetical protein O2955_15415 [Planctomycetota bacterium]|nr:hypothetical protein [Planctomycetota bacterium]MDA1213903.1 hypothetical protein [Planctomycetota bacterium]
MPRSQFQIDVALLCAALLGLAALMSAEQWITSNSDPEPPVTPASPARKNVESTEPQPGQTSPSRTRTKPRPRRYDESARYIPRELTVLVSADLVDIPLTVAVQYLKDESGIDILLDRDDLLAEGIPLDLPINDHLHDEPLYLFLDRLTFQQRIGWYVRDEIVHLTSAILADERLVILSYPVGNLLQIGYTPRPLIETIMQNTSGLWEDDGDGEGTIDVVQGVLVVRQTDFVQREIAELLDALRKPERQRYINDPSQHQRIRQTLQQPLTIDVHQRPLNEVVADLSKRTGVDIRFDINELYDRSFETTMPITLQLTNKSLRAVLDAIHPSELGWFLESGVIWFTLKEAVDEHLKTAVYDVRDICRDEKTQLEMVRVVYSLSGGLWEDHGDGEGTLTSPARGIMVIRQTERAHDEIIKILEQHRYLRR